jgi:hypothetical protein
MLHNREDMKNWKMDQLHYFRKYLSVFKKGSREYDLILSGINQLERTN